MDIFLVSLSMFFITVSAVPLLPSSHWLVRVWEFPRLQLAVLIAVTLITLLCYNGLSLPPWLLVTLVSGLSISLLYQAIWILPYTPFYRKEVNKDVNPQKERIISILSSNVYMPNSNYHKLIEHIHTKKPDFVVTLESNEKWERALKPIEKDYPFTQFCSLENLYGMHLYSKYEFVEHTLRFLVEDDVPSVKITIMIDGERVTLQFLHPKPPSPTENEYARPRDIELNIVGQEVAQTSGPIIVAGDLNDVAWSPTTRKFKKISGLLDPREGRGFYNTFHAHYPLIKWPLDHVFHSSHFALVDLERLSDIGSDHYPLYTELVLK
ncbi:MULTISPECIES: endonuclease/exonuclease/phosphatase family protein [unclassified Alteromonas]|uniref:endonuclease/exonuclease/phosphatase family protein n=1 Tax=unclassified Alteromonas TaxID=2614992 RepID=UPI0005094B5E|nr:MULTISPECIES: endonuclease/exonuclease/phosphatase family protein [unclassified Alteromonas]